MIEKKTFGSLANGTEIMSYRIRNASGAYAELLTYGATLQSLVVPDRNGILADVIVGFDSIEGHETRSASQGNTIGRYANRIADGRFQLDGKRYELTKNEKGITCLHGGGEFAAALWEAEPEGENALRLHYTSPDGAHGFPGTVKAEVLYTFTEENALCIDFYAVSDQKTVLNLTNHAYFNLSGVLGSDVLGHELQINAECFTPTDERSIPTGELHGVQQTPFDFRTPKAVGKEIHEEDAQLRMCRGYDHNFCLNDASGPKEETAPAAVLYEPESGRMMKVFTDLPGVQLYTGNFLAGEPGKGTIPLQQHAGLCLETQYYPDTPNQPAFPQCTFNAGEAFESRTEFCFSAK